MECIALAVDHGKPDLLKSARLKISEWLDSEKEKSNIIATVYLEFSDSRKRQSLDHMYIIFPRKDFGRIILPTKHEIDEENRILKQRELSRMMNIRGEYIPPIFVDNILVVEQNEEHVLVRVELENYEADDNNIRRFQFGFHIQDSFKRARGLSRLFGSTWDWSYEAPMAQLRIDKNEFPEIIQIQMDLELWVMIEPTMYNSVSDLNIQSTQPFDRLVILPKDIAEKLERSPETLCMRWFFLEFSESGLGAEIIISKKRSDLEREKRYVKEINKDPGHFFSVVRQILNESRITCVDFGYVSARLEKSEFSKILEILFQLLYHRNDPALLRLEELADTLEQYKESIYGNYYFYMFKLLHEMRACEEVKDITTPNIRRLLEEFLDEIEFPNTTTVDLFIDLSSLIDLIEQFYYYNSPEDKYRRKKEILTQTAKLRTIAEHKLINPESYLIAEEVLLKWERLIEEEFERFVGTPKLNIELKTKRLLFSDQIHLIFEITNVRDVPMVSLAARLLPSEEYEIPEQKKRETHARKRLTKSDDQNLRIFSPEFMIIPKKFPHVQIKLEVEFFTEEGKRFVEESEKKIELFHEDIEDIEFKEIDPNPYIVGSPVKEEEMFYGREDVFTEIRGTIVGKKLINQAIIYGQHRIGKTSVLYQLINVLEGIYVPVLAIKYKFEKGDSDLLHSWSSRIAVAVKKRTSWMPKIPDYGKSSDPYRRFQEFLDSVIERLEGAKIIFMIDEYDLIDDFVQNKKIDKEIFGLLEKMIKHEKVELIMAGRIPIEGLKAEEWKDIGRPFVQKRLGPLAKREATRLIEEPLKGKLKYDDSAKERIFKLTNCHPYLIQLCCQVLVNYHNSERKRILKYADIEKKIPDIVELGSPGLETMILTDATEEEKIVLRVVAAFLRNQTSISEEELVVRISKYNPQIGDSEIKQALSNLEKKEIVRSVTEEMKRFKFVCDLFRHWIYAKMEPL